MRRFAAGIFLWGLSSAILWADQGPARASLEAFSLELETLSADFQQVIVSADGQLMEEGFGALALQRPGLFRWSYGGEFPELIVADGRRLWMYDEGLEQVTVREQTGLPGDSPLMLLTNLEGLDEQFEVTELGDIGGMQLLELSVKTPDAQFERILLGFRAGQLERMVMEDSFGMRTELYFDKVRKNPTLDPQTFLFEPPAGVDLVGDVADLPDQQ